MKNLVVFVVSFVLVFIVSLIFYFVRKKENKLKENKEFRLLIGKFNLNKDKLNYNKLGLLFVFVNSLIISSTGTVCTMVKMKLIWQLCIAFVMIMALIYGIYGIIGQILKKEEGKKNAKRKGNRKKVD